MHVIILPRKYDYYVSTMRAHYIGGRSSFLPYAVYQISRNNKIIEMCQIRQTSQNIMKKWFKLKLLIKDCLDTVLD